MCFTSNGRDLFSDIRSEISDDRNIKVLVWWPQKEGPPWEPPEAEYILQLCYQKAALEIVTIFVCFCLPSFITLPLQTEGIPSIEEKPDV